MIEQQSILILSVSVLNLILVNALLTNKQNKIFFLSINFIHQCKLFKQIIARKKEMHLTTNIRKIAINFNFSIKCKHILTYILGASETMITRNESIELIRWTTFHIELFGMQRNIIFYNKEENAWNKHSPFR